MKNRNTTLNLPASLIAKTKAYAAENGTTMTTIVRKHLEAVTAGPESAEENPLDAYAEGRITREAAIRQLGVRDYAQLLIALGDAGLTPPWPPEHELENEALLFERIWKSA